MDPTRLPHEPTSSPKPKSKLQRNRKLIAPSDRKPNTWSSHVKQYCVEDNVKYRDALRTPECKTEYYKKKTVQEN